MSNAGTPWSCIFCWLKLYTASYLIRCLGVLIVLLDRCVSVALSHSAGRSMSKSADYHVHRQMTVRIITKVGVDGSNVCILLTKFLREWELPPSPDVIQIIHICKIRY
jgi:hypothetical protein